MTNRLSTHWLDDMAAFVRSVELTAGCEMRIPFAREPCASDEIISAVESRLGSLLPKIVRELISFGSSSFGMRYALEPKAAESDVIRGLFATQSIVGGGTIRLRDLPKHKEDARAWAEETWLAEEPDQQELWLKSLPFLRMDNGDYLSLDLRRPADDPPVLYLSHDDESQTIAASFTGFLQAWERVCYVGPESWMLEPFIDPETGLLDGDCANAKKLRKWIRESK